jgi:PPP family 3-phenylpropionic acid transporter
MLPTLRLSVYWFFVVGALGVFFPYFTLYLKENAGLTGGQTGMVFSVVPLVGMFAQPLWGHVADRTGWRTRLLAALALGASTGYAGLTLPGSFAGLLAATALLALFSTSLIPMGVSVSLAALEGQRISGFGRVRAWGTVGFLLTVVGIPPLLHLFQKVMGLPRRAGGPSEPGLQYVFLVAGLLVGLGAVAAWMLPRTGSVSLQAARGEYRILLRHGPFLRVLVFTFFSFLFIQGPMVLFPIYVRARGGDMETVSHMWICMLMLEIPLVASLGTIHEHLGPRTMVSLAAILGGVRWFTCAVATDLGFVYPVQLLHAFVVAGLLVGAPVYVESLIPQRLRSTGQGLLMTLGASIGGILSATVSGWLIDRFDANAPYLVGGVGAILVGLVGSFFLPAVPAESREGDAVRTK